MFNLLDSHDTERILTTAQGNVQHVKAALTFLYLQKGTPCIYYGTELALIGGPDPDCRRVMPWDRVSEDNDMLNFMKKLIKVRKEVASMIQHGSYCLQEVKPDVLALSWNYQGKEVQAIFNQSSEKYTLDRDSVDLASHCQFEDGQQVILPAGFVVYLDSI